MAPYALLCAADLAPELDDLAAATTHLASAVFDDPATIEVRQRILAFCDANPDALYRSCVPGHLTGSAFVVDDGGTRTLLLHHAKLDRWLQPGGHADGWGNLAAVALKEAEEETGITGLQVVAPAIDVDIHAIPARGDDPEHLHLDVRFLVLAPPGAEIRHNDESLDARWATGEDPAIATSTELSRGVTRALEAAAAVRSM